MKTVQVLDKKFALSISETEIKESVKRMASELNRDLEGKDVLFLGILNGCFMFASDLMKEIDIPCQISFVKIASYQGTSSTGNVKRLIGINEDIKDKTVVILEDIIDSGITMENIVKQLKGYEPAKILISTFLFKPDAFIKDFEIQYVGMKIPNDFIVGYGLDYDGFGRNLRDIYTLIS